MKRYGNIYSFIKDKRKTSSHSSAKFPVKKEKEKEGNGIDSKQVVQMVMTNIQLYDKGRVEQDLESKIEAFGRRRNGSHTPSKFYSNTSFSKLGKSTGPKFDFHRSVDQLRESPNGKQINDQPNRTIQIPKSYFKTTVCTQSRAAEVQESKNMARTVFGDRLRDSKQRPRSFSSSVMYSTYDKEKSNEDNHQVESSIEKELGYQSGGSKQVFSKEPNSNSNFNESKVSLSIFPKKKKAESPSKESRKLPVIFSSRNELQSEFSPKTSIRMIDSPEINSRKPLVSQGKGSFKGKPALGLGDSEALSNRQSVDFSRSALNNGSPVHQRERSHFSLQRTNPAAKPQPVVDRNAAISKIITSSKIMPELGMTESKLFNICYRLVAMVNYCQECQISFSIINSILEELEGNNGEINRIFTNYRNRFLFDELELFRICRTGKIRPKMLGYPLTASINPKDELFQIENKKNFIVRLSKLRWRLSETLLERKKEAMSFQGSTINNLLDKRLREQNVIGLEQNLRSIMKKERINLDLNDLLKAFDSQAPQNRPIRWLVKEFKRTGLDVNIDLVNPDVVLRNNQVHQISSDMIVK